MPSRPSTLAVSILAVSLGGPIAVASAPTAAAAPSGVVATFEGRYIDLVDGWGLARACRSDGITTACFRSRAAMLAAGPPTAPATSCASATDLFSATNYGGTDLSLSAPVGSWINLSAYGFDKRTMSYTIGACSAYLNDGAGGQGATYPVANTTAYSFAPAMAAGWADRVSSIYLT